MVESISTPSNGDRPVSKFIKLLDYIFFLRPMLHPPVWTIVILGFFRVSAGGPTIKLIYLLLISSAAAGWAYIINQISDIESDRINNKLHFLPKRIISLKAAYILAVLMLLFTIVGGFLIGKIIGILFIFGLTLGYIYSGKPFYGKNHPIVGALSNGIAHGMMPFVAGYVAAGGELGRGLVCSTPCIFAVCAVFIGTTIPDIPGDKKVGKITPGVALGISRSTIVMTVCLTTAFVLALIVGDTPLAFVAGLSLPFYIIGIFRPGELWAVMSIKVSIILLSGAACIIFWPYTVLLFVLFMATRFYYRQRFGMVYPRLG
jgi:4-hydroxybenzoate polyprenyltransferase